ncbi:MAG: GNAT family N-acetyltransferase [Thermoplasmata archaeon]|jgi:GNAT superfamily N-acetyltransferase|nr:GNAT family N-acetyltransferase [Thermoplasmata archaeon]
MRDDDRTASVVTNLVEALEVDPFYSRITRDFSTDRFLRRRALEAYFDYSMKEGREIGTVQVSDDQTGAAIWTLPQPPSVEAEAKREKHRFLEGVLGRQGMADYDRIIEFMSDRTSRSIDGDAWYLSILGVSPAAQGKGIGSDLLRPTLDEADRAGALCYLETYSPRALRFYGRMGFEVVSSHIEPVTSSEYWVMVRRPR